MIARLGDAVAFEPAFQAYELRKANVPWPRVARLCGFASVAACATAVTRFYQGAALARGRELAEYALQTELDRLDDLAATFYVAAHTGDLDAAKFLLSISAQRGRWQGWERTDRTDEGPRTIIISGGPEMAAELRAAAHDAHPHLVIDGGEG